MVDGFGFPRIQLQPGWPMSSSSAFADALVRRVSMEMQQIRLQNASVVVVVGEEGKAGSELLNQIITATMRAVANVFVTAIPEITLVPVPVEDDLKHADLQVLERIFGSVGAELARRKALSESGDKR